jgi:hypothetical protein
VVLCKVTLCKEHSMLFIIWVWTWPPAQFIIVIYFNSISELGGIHRTDSVAPDVIVRILVCRGDIQFSVKSEPRLGYFTFRKFYLWQRWRLLHTDLTGDRVQNSGTESSVSYTNTTRAPPHPVLMVIPFCNMFTVSSNNTNLIMCGIRSYDHLRISPERNTA